MPTGYNLWNQTLKARRRRNAGSLDGLQRQLWHWIQVVHDGVESAINDGDQDTAIKWLHVGCQVSGVYAKIVVGGDFEARISAIENRDKVVGNGHVPELLG